MVDHTIKTKNREIQFEGELIASGDTTVTFDDSNSCCMVAKAYAVAGGGYVTLLECKFPESCGGKYRTFEEIDSLHDIENFFYVFESDDIFGEGLKPLKNDRDQTAARLKKLSAEYEKMVFDFLDQLHAESAARGLQDKVKAKPAEKSIWKKLGIG